MCSYFLSSILMLRTKIKGLLGSGHSSPRCIGTSAERADLALPRSKPNLARMVFEASRQKNQTPALTRYPRSARCNSARRRNQAGPKLPYDTDSGKTKYIQSHMQRIVYISIIPTLYPEKNFLKSRIGNKAIPCFL